MYSEELFISELNRKKDQAWKELYKDFYPALCAYACRILKDRQVAEDIVQECLVFLWDSTLKFPNIRALAAYLYRSIYHRSLNMVRDRGNVQKALAELGQDLNDLPDEDTAYKWAVEETVVIRFRTILADLSPAQQKIMTLSMEGKKVHEIAHHLGVSENTVKMQKKRAYAEVRERMGKAGSILFFSLFKNIF